LLYISPNTVIFLSDLKRLVTLPFDVIAIQQTIQMIKQI